jgi:hypothetical protein
MKWQPSHLTDIPIRDNRPNGKGDKSKDTPGTVCSHRFRQRTDVWESGATWRKDVRTRKGSGGASHLTGIPIHDVYWL